MHGKSWCHELNGGSDEDLGDKTEEKPHNTQQILEANFIVLIFKCNFPGRISMFGIVLSDKLVIISLFSDSSVTSTL